MLPDGDYDAVVVDADAIEGEVGVAHVELTIVSGPHIGEIVAIRGHFGDRDPIELLGLPATIVVVDGQPDVRLDA